MPSVNLLMKLMNLLNLTNKAQIHEFRQEGEIEEILSFEPDFQIGLFIWAI